MGAKQSSPTANPAANGRTRAYSGSDLPSTTSSSNGAGVSRTATGGMRYHAYGASAPSGASSSTSRSRSMGGPGTRAQSGINIPSSSGVYSSPESGGSSPEEVAGERERSGTAGQHEGPRLLIGSLPAHLSPHMFGGNPYVYMCMPDHSIQDKGTVLQKVI